MAAEKDWTSKLVKAMLNNSTESISVAYLAKINKLSPPEAELQPLAVIGGKKQNVVSKARFLVLPLVGKDVSLNLDYRVGDNVVAIVLDDDDMYFTNKSTFKVDSNRKHAIDFAYVIGKVADATDFKGGG